jgi:hypothetical protein
MTLRYPDTSQLIVHWRYENYCCYVANAWFQTNTPSTMILLHVREVTAGFSSSNLLTIIKLIQSYNVLAWFMFFLHLNRYSRSLK